MSDFTCISLICPWKNKCATHLHNVQETNKECRAPVLIAENCQHFKALQRRWGDGPDVNGEAE